MKVFQVGLCSIWLSGFVLIALSLYVTQRLPSLNDRIKVPKLNLGDLGKPRITIFSAPSPFNGSVGARQTRSRSFTSDIFVLIDPETILLNDFISTLNYAYELDRDWLLVASSRNISHFPFYLDEAGKRWRRGMAITGPCETTLFNCALFIQLQEILCQSWQWNHCKGRMLMAWNSGDLPLHTGVLPPFLYGKGIHNNWLINEAMSSDFRFVFDSSWTISSFHLYDPEPWSSGVVGNSKVSGIEMRSWEYVGNSHIGALYGSLLYHEANYSSLVKLLKCDRKYIFFNPTENFVYPYGYQSSFRLWKERILHPWRKRRIMACIDGINSLEKYRIAL
ncbi:beta-arabinofuranosyltransferase ray1 [Quercus suber]|uniref:Beta-arabinofuranosyltransferase ray1 n=1 Tax=Quercus suber TaxID=58331 RepID=A0AAW0KMP1_QUESU